MADDDNVAITYTLTGTHRGDFHGIAPTGEKTEARGVQIGSFEDGQIVEGWGSRCLRGAAVVDPRLSPRDRHQRVRTVRRRRVWPERS